MDGGGGLGDVPGQAAAKLLNADPLVESWSGVSYSTLQLDGVNVPVHGRHAGRRRGPAAPQRARPQARIRWCSAPRRCASCTSGSGTPCVVRIHGSKPVTLTIVGTATLPPIGVAGSSHLEMGTGALLSYRLIPPAARNLFEVTPGPNAILVRTKGGASPAALRSLQAIGRKLDIASNGGSVFAVQRPAADPQLRIARHHAAAPGRGAGRGRRHARSASRWSTSVRRRRRDLAILKTLGFTGRQLATAVAVQAGVAAVIGCAVGIPAGIALGRVLWDLFAAEISAVPDPTVPGGTVARDRAPRPRAGDPGRHDPRPPGSAHDDVAAPARRIATPELSRRSGRPAARPPAARCPACRSAC